MIKVTICGPNLRDQSKGSFHVHTAGCGDLARGARREPEYRYGWTVEAETKRDVVFAIYSDQLAEGASFEACREDIYFMACCNTLPEGEER